MSNFDDLDVIEPSPLDADSDDDERFVDALYEEVRQLEEEEEAKQPSDPKPHLRPQFKSLEEAKREIEREGEEFRLKKEKERGKQFRDLQDEFEEFKDATENVEQEEELCDDEETKAEEEHPDLMVEERKRREGGMTDEEIQHFKDTALSLKKEGNDFYLAKDYEKAVEYYTKALDTCPLKFSEERATYYANRAAANMAMDLCEMALKDCHSALELKPDYVKVLVRRGNLYEKMDKPHEAMQDFKSVLEIDKGHKDARVAVQRLPEKIAKKDEEIKQEMFGNLRKLGDMVLNPFGLSCNNFQFQKDESTGSYSVNFKQNS